MKKLLVAVMATVAAISSLASTGKDIRYKETGDINTLVKDLNTSDWQWYFYCPGSNSYWLTADLTSYADGVGFYLSPSAAQPGANTVDLRNHTWSFTRGSGVSFYHYPGTMVWKNGTLNFDAISGSVYKMLGNSCGDSDSTAINYQNQHGVYENVTIVRGTGTKKTLKMMLGTAESDLLVTNSTIDVKADDLVLFSPNHTAMMAGGVNNRIMFVDSTVKCGRLYTDTSSTGPVEPIDIQSEVVFDHSTIEVGLGQFVGGDGTCYLGQALGGVKMTITNGSKYSSGSSGWGLDLNVNDPLAHGNTLVVNGGSTIELSGKNLSIGHARNASGNSVYLEDCTVNCGQVIMGTQTNEFGKTMSNNNRLFIGEGAVVNSSSQFMCCGQDNTMTVSNGTFKLLNYQYAFYFAHTAESTNNKFTLMGDHPLIDIRKDSNKSAELNFKNGMTVDIYLPENGEYKHVPFLTNKFKPDGTVKFHFFNTEMVRKTLDEDKEIVIARADDTMWGVNAEGLPTGCTFKTVDRRMTTGYYEAVLTLTPSRLQVAQVGTKKFFTYDAAAEALQVGDTLTLINTPQPSTDESCTIVGKSDIVLNPQGRLIRDLTIDATTMATKADFMYGQTGQSEKNAYNAVDEHKLTVQNGSVLQINGQFAVVGTNNTVTVDDAMIKVSHHYGIYLGYPGTLIKSENMMVNFKGRNPVLKVTQICADEGQALYGKDWGTGNIQNAAIVFELPEDPEDIYPEAVIQSGANFDVVNTCTYEFRNLRKLQSTVGDGEELLVPLMSSANGKPTFAATPAVKLQPNCEFVTLKEANGATTLYLKIGAFAAVEVDGKAYGSYEAGYAALKDGSVIRLLSDEDDLVVTTDKKVTLNFNNFTATSLTLEGAGEISPLNGSYRGIIIGQDSPTPGKQTPAENRSLEVRDGMTLRLNDQFMCCGTNNTLTVDDATIYIENYRYAFYFGHSYTDTNPDISKDNTVIFRGKQPKILADYVDEEGVGGGQISIMHSRVVFELVPGALYTEPVLQASGGCSIDNDCSVEFLNLEEAIAAIVAEEGEDFEPRDIPLMSSDNGSLGFLEDGDRYRDNALLPAGCYMWKAADSSAVYLHIGHADEILFAGGCGTPEDPFIIDSAETFAEIEERAKTMNLESACYRQTESFELTDWYGLLANYEGSASHSPFGGFHAFYDGGDCSIDVTFAEDAPKYTGLFNVMRSGAIANLNVTVYNGEDAPCTGLGGIVGVVGGSGVVSNCTVSGAIYGTHNCGGVAIKATDNAAIVDCSNFADITTSYTKAGGIVAFVQYDRTDAAYTNRIVNCANEGMILSTCETHDGNRGAGGIVGWACADMVMNGCVNVGEVRWPGDAAVAEVIGGFGSVNGSEVTLTAEDCAWNFGRGYGVIFDEGAAVFGLDAEEGEDPIAYIGETPYYRLVDAVASVGDYDTILLNGEITLDAPVIFNGKTGVTFDLNGQAVLASDDGFYGTSLIKAVNSEVAIVDGEGGIGSLYAEEVNLVEAMANSTVEIYSGTFSGALANSGGKVKIPGDSIAAFDRDQSRFCESGYKTEYDEDTEFWYVTEGGDEPTEPVEPGEETTVEAESEDEAIAKVEVSVPAEVAESGDIDEEEYKAMFSKSAVELGEGLWLVTVQVREEVVEDVEAAIEEASAAILATPGEAGEVEIATKPGLFYSVDAGETIDGMDEGDRVMGNGQSLPLEVPAIDGDTGFYSIRVNLKSN